MLGIAELRRRTNHPAARAAGDWNEKDGVPWRLKKDADSQMDLHNNRTGERIGRVARNMAEVERILGELTRLWTAVDARKVMQDRIYTQSTHSRQAEAFEKARKHFEHRDPAPTRGRAATQSRARGGGPVYVDA